MNSSQKTKIKKLFMNKKIKMFNKKIVQEWKKKLKNKINKYVYKYNTKKEA